MGTNSKSPKSPNVPIRAPHLRDLAGVPGMVGGEIDRHPERELRGPQLPITGSGTAISAENRATIDSSARVIERTTAAPSHTAGWGTISSPMGPGVVDCGTPPLLGGLPEPQVRNNLSAAGPISPVVEQLDAENRRVSSLTPDPHGHLGPARELPTPMSGSRRFPSLVEESPSLGVYPSPPSGSRLNATVIEESPTQIEED